MENTMYRAAKRMPDGNYIIREEEGITSEDILEGFKLQPVEFGYDGMTLHIKGTAPDPDMEELKKLKRSDINNLRDEHLKNDGAEYKGDLFDIDEKSQNIIQNKAFSALLNPDKIFSYRSKTNKDHDLTSQEVIELKEIIENKVNEIYQRSFELKDKLSSDEIKTFDDLKNLTWENN